MRKISVMLAPLLLAGCIKDSATYYINGNEHTITVRATQEYFWRDDVELTLLAARWPDCQRQFVLGKVPVSEMNVELFDAGGNVYSLRAGSRLWQVETRNCGQLPTPASEALGQPVGAFRIDGEKMGFDKTDQQ